MNLVMPYYKHDLAPLSFPGFFIEGDDEVDQSYSNESDKSLQIDDILNNSTTTVSTNDSTDTTIPGSLHRQLTHNSSASSGRSKSSMSFLHEKSAPSYVFVADPANWTLSYCFVCLNNNLLEVIQSSVLSVYRNMSH